MYFLFGLHQLYFSSLLYQLEIEKVEVKYLALFPSLVEKKWFFAGL